MGKYPVIFLSLKGVEGLTFEEARDSLCELITSEVRRFKLLLNSALLDNDEKIYIMNWFLSRIVRSLNLERN